MTECSTCRRCPQAILAFNLPASVVGAHIAALHKLSAARSEAATKEWVTQVHTKGHDALNGYIAAVQAEGGAHRAALDWNVQVRSIGHDDLCLSIPSFLYCTFQRVIFQSVQLH